MKQLYENFLQILDGYVVPFYKWAFCVVSIVMAYGFALDHPRYKLWYVAAFILFVIFRGRGWIAGKK